MEITSSLVIKTDRNGRSFQFLIPIGAQYGEAYDAAFEILVEINKMSQKAMENLKPQAETPIHTEEVAS